MDGYIIIDVIISLAFIYLTYSLLTSILVEIVDTVINLRARNLRKAIKKMLQDEDYEMGDWSKNFFDSQSTEKEFVKEFYNHPSIKFLGKNKWYPSPNNIEPKVFAKVIVDLLSKERGYSSQQQIENTIGYFDGFDSKMAYSEKSWNEFVTQYKASEDKDKHLKTWLDQFRLIDEEGKVEFTNQEMQILIGRVDSISDTEDKYKHILRWRSKLEPSLKIDPETNYHLCLLYKESGGDVEKFKSIIQEWFDDTVKVSISWYKKWTARIAFCIGFIIAIGFNVDTLYIGNQLVENEAVRSGFVAQIESHKLDPEKVDEISDEIGEANQKILSSFALSDWSNIYQIDTVWHTCCIKEECCIKEVNKSKPPGKFFYALLGWIITALAISFGAPFWFDLLNKFIKFKGGVGSKSKPKEEKQKKAKDTKPSASEGDYI